MVLCLSLSCIPFELVEGTGNRGQAWPRSRSAGEGRSKQQRHGFPASGDLSELEPLAGASLGGGGMKRCFLCPFPAESASRQIGHMPGSWAASVTVKRSWGVSIHTHMHCSMCVRCAWMCTLHIYVYIHTHTYVHLLYMCTYAHTCIYVYKCGHIHTEICNTYINTMDFTIYSCEGKQKRRSLLNLFQGEKNEK